jgi:predicted MFS family arabinose efflux permease
VGGLFITALFIPVPFFFTAKGLWISLFVILGIAGAMAFTPIYPLIADGVGPADQGIAYSLNSWIFSIGYLLGPWIGGVLAGFAGMQAPFFLCSALLLASILAIWMMSGRNGSWSG